MMPVEKFVVRPGVTVAIYTDTAPFDPREEYEHLATFVCWHPRLKLGDRQVQRMTEDELMRSTNEGFKAVLPVYLYEHGGVTMSTAPFGDAWDSGQVGWAYVTRRDAKAWGCGEDFDYEEAIRVEVREYDRYLTGEVYGYVIENAEGEELDSCWGFLEGLADVRKVARDAAEHVTDPGVQRAADELAARATYAMVPT